MIVSELMDRFTGYRNRYVFFVSFYVLYEGRGMEHWCVFNCGVRVIINRGGIYCWSFCFLIVVLSSGFFCIVYGVVFSYGRYFIVAIIIWILSIVGSCRFQECRCVVK